MFWRPQWMIFTFLAYLEKVIAQNFSSVPEQLPSCRHLSRYFLH